MNLFSFIFRIVNSPGPSISSSKGSSFSNGDSLTLLGFGGAGSALNITIVFRPPIVFIFRGSSTRAYGPGSAESSCGGDPEDQKARRGFHLCRLRIDGRSLPKDK